MARVRRNWTVDEDERLQQAVKNGEPIARFPPLPEPHSPDIHFSLHRACPENQKEPYQVFQKKKKSNSQGKKKALAESRPLLWRELAKSVPGRTNKDCRKRWWNTMAQGTAKGTWSEEEDKRLTGAVQRYGTKWRKVSGYVGSRTPDQCSSHWSQVLDPSINYCDWTADEVRRLRLTPLNLHHKQHPAAT